MLDEPLGALDLKLREEMQVELKTIQRDVGITFVFVTHDQGEALSMSNRIAVFNKGRVEQVGTPRDIYDHPATAFVAGFVGISNVLSAERSQQLFGIAEPHSIRPERLRVVQHETAEGEISVAGVVSDVQYLGADCRVRVQLDDGTSMIASVPSDGLAGVAIGGNVRLGMAALTRHFPSPIQISPKRGRRMKKSRYLGALVAMTLLASACGERRRVVGGDDALTAIGEGEKALNLIVWAGYAEDGSTYPEYDWVHPFQDQTGCVVKSKIGRNVRRDVPTDETGDYDGVSASGDSSVRLIDAGHVSPVNTA